MQAKTYATHVNIETIRERIGAIRVRADDVGTEIGAIRAGISII